jgi:hypothetical protein
VEFVPHVPDDTLERYAIQTLSDAESGPMEDHLLICGGCRNRLNAEIEFVTAMRGAAAKIRYQKHS